MKDLKNFVKPVLFLTIGLLLISLVRNFDFTSMMLKIQNNIQQGLTVVKITDEKSEIKDDNLNIKFKVPSIHYDDKEVEKSINNYIKKNIKEYINVQRQINKMNKYSEKHVVNITYNVAFEDENLINIIIEKDTTWGKNDYKLEKDSYVFNLNTGKRVYLDDLLKDNDDYSSVITETIKKDITNKHPLYDNLNIDRNTNYYIQDRYINIYFNPYKQSKDSTQYEFKVPYDAFKNKIEAFNNFFLITVNSEVIKKNNKYLKSNLNIPIIKSDNAEIDNKVNKKIRDDIMNFYEQSLKEAENYLDDFALDESNFVADASFEVKKNNPNVISVLVKYYKYSGGAHGYYEYVSYNINLKDGSLISLKDIFKDDVNYKLLINNKIESQIKELAKKEKDLDKVYDFSGIKDNQKFYLDDSNIVIYFDLYEIAPYAAGIPEFPIAVDNIKQQIKELYIQLII
ncbi:DUF3298 and DUF4163 domain-containing protein [Terrisporobacter sp.]